MLIWEGRTMSLWDRNVVVLEKLGHGMVLVERKETNMRLCVRRQDLKRKIHGRKRKWQLV